MTSPAVAHVPGRRRGGGTPLGRDRHRLRAGRRHARAPAGNFDGSRAFSQLPHVERPDGESLRRRPADERDRGDREALPRPRPRERQHRQRAHRDPGRRVEAPPGTAAVPGSGQGRREARDGLDRGLSQARRLEEAGRVLEHDHQRAAAEEARLQGHHRDRLAHGAGRRPDPAHRDPGDARRLRPAHLRRGERERARLLHAARRRSRLHAPPEPAHAGGGAHPGAQGLARRAAAGRPARARARAARASRRRGATSAAP